MPASTNAPTVEVSAKELLSRWDKANKLSAKLSGVCGIVHLLNETLTDDTPENNALFAVRDMLEECLQLSNGLQWTGGDADRAERALRVTS